MRVNLISVFVNRCITDQLHTVLLATMTLKRSKSVVLLRAARLAIFFAHEVAFHLLIKSAVAMALVRDLVRTPRETLTVNLVRATRLVGIT